jgi:hypothetical protein
VHHVALFFVVCGNVTGQPITITWLNNNVVGCHKRGIAIATQIALGKCGGIVASNIFSTNEASHYPTGCGVALGTITLSVPATIVFLVFFIVENRKKVPRNYDYLFSLPAEEPAELGDEHPSFRFTY